MLCRHSTTLVIIILQGVSCNDLVYYDFLDLEVEYTTPSAYVSTQGNTMIDDSLENPENKTWRVVQKITTAPNIKDNEHVNGQLVLSTEYSDKFYYSGSGLIWIDPEEQYENPTISSSIILPDTMGFMTEIYEKTSSTKKQYIEDYAFEHSEKDTYVVVQEKPPLQNDFNDKLFILTSTNHAKSNDYFDISPNYYGSRLIWYEPEEKYEDNIIIYEKYKNVADKIISHKNNMKHYAIRSAEISTRHMIHNIPRHPILRRYGGMTDNSVLGTSTNHPNIKWFQLKKEYASPLTIERAKADSMKIKTQGYTSMSNRTKKGDNARRHSGRNIWKAVKELTKSLYLKGQVNIKEKCFQPTTTIRPVIIRFMPEEQFENSLNSLFIKESKFDKTHFSADGLTNVTNMSYLGDNDMRNTKALSKEQAITRNSIVIAHGNMTDISDLTTGTNHRVSSFFSEHSQVISLNNYTNNNVFGYIESSTWNAVHVTTLHPILDSHANVDDKSILGIKNNQPVTFTFEPEKHSKNSSSVWSIQHDKIDTLPLEFMTEAYLSKTNKYYLDDGNVNKDDKPVLATKTKRPVTFTFEPEKLFKNPSSVKSIQDDTTVTNTLEFMTEAYVSKTNKTYLKVVPSESSTWNVVQEIEGRYKFKSHVNAIDKSVLTAKSYRPIIISSKPEKQYENFLTSTSVHGDNINRIPSELIMEGNKSIKNDSYPGVEVTRYTESSASNTVQETKKSSNLMNYIKITAKPFLTTTLTRTDIEKQIKNLLSPMSNEKDKFDILQSIMKLYQYFEKSSTSNKYNKDITLRHTKNGTENGLYKITTNYTLEGYVNVTEKFVFQIATNHPSTRFKSGEQYETFATPKPIEWEKIGKIRYIKDDHISITNKSYKGDNDIEHIERTTTPVIKKITRSPTLVGHVNVTEKSVLAPSISGPKILGFDEQYENPLTTITMENNKIDIKQASVVTNKTYKEDSAIRNTENSSRNVFDEITRSSTLKESVSDKFVVETVTNHSEITRMKAIEQFENRATPIISEDVKILPYRSNTKDYYAIEHTERSSWNASRSPVLKTHVSATFTSVLKTVKNHPAIAVVKPEDQYENPPSLNSIDDEKTDILTFLRQNRTNSSNKSYKADTTFGITEGKTLFVVREFINIPPFEGSMNMTNKSLSTTSRNQLGFLSPVSIQKNKKFVKNTFRNITNKKYKHNSALINTESSISTVTQEITRTPSLKRYETMKPNLVQERSISKRKKACKCYKSKKRHVKKATSNMKNMITKKYKRDMTVSNKTYINIAVEMNKTATTVEDKIQKRLRGSKKNNKLTHRQSFTRPTINHFQTIAKPAIFNMVKGVPRSKTDIPRMTVVTKIVKANIRTCIKRRNKRQAILNNGITPMHKKQKKTTKKVAQHKNDLGITKVMKKEVILDKVYSFITLKAYSQSKRSGKISSTRNILTRHLKDLQRKEITKTYQTNKLTIDKSSINIPIESGSNIMIDKLMNITRTYKYPFAIKTRMDNKGETPTRDKRQNKKETTKEKWIKRLITLTTLAVIFSFLFTF